MKVKLRTCLIYFISSTTLRTEKVFSNQLGSEIQSCGVFYTPVHAQFCVVEMSEHGCAFFGTPPLERSICVNAGIWAGL